MKQGKCNNCNILFQWRKEIPGKLCKCPKCGQPLKRTTHLLSPIYYDRIDCGDKLTDYIYPGKKMDQ